MRFIGFLILLLPSILNAQQDTSSIEVQGLCVMCQVRIEQAALKTKGINWASWDDHERKLFFTTEVGFKEEKLHKKIAAKGHDTNKAKAPQAAYDKLPLCCKYRDFETHDDVDPNKLKSGKNRSENDQGKRDQNDEDKTALHIDHDGHQEDGHDSHEGQDHLCGMIYGQNESGIDEPLIGANVYWLGSTEGTSTDNEGHFELHRKVGQNTIVLSYVGYGSDTINIQEGFHQIAAVMYPANFLEVVEVKHRKRATEVSFIDPIKTYKIDEKELLKAACCNLSESFETNAAVDVTFTDAITGVRQIQMLGLAGPYVQIMRENIPEIRGLAAIQGLAFTPGTWIESIQMNLGMGSVVNGFESFSGQINTELRKSDEGDKLSANIYANQGGRLEANVHMRYQLNENVSTAALLHGSLLQSENDRNNDNFLDNPFFKSLIALNRWKWYLKNNWRLQLGIKGTLLEKEGGFTPNLDLGNAWRSSVDTKRLDAWTKIGRVFPERPYASMGLQLAASIHDQDAGFGPDSDKRNFDAQHNSLYANFIYQSILGTTDHKFKTGVSFQHDAIDEFVQEIDYSRNESAVGAFWEYTYTHMDKFTLVLGVRGDYHNQYDFFATPRLNLRYAITDDWVWRFSAGRALRTAHIFAENIGLFASNRVIQVVDEHTNTPYGLDAEIAWNFGINTQKDLYFGTRLVSLGLDYYYTRFENQIVADWEEAQSISFYNVNGESFSHAFLAQINFEPIDRFSVRLAYRYNDVQTDYNGGRLLKPLIANHRTFVNLAYATNNKWHFDLTGNLISEKRIPNTDGTTAFDQAQFSDPFTLFNMQISKNWNDRFEIYLGAENVFDFRQANPIINVENPLDPGFDASLVWGPIFGRNIYTGLRYKI